MPHLLRKPAKNTTYENSFRDFICTLYFKNPSLLNRKYFCLSVWSIACQPCLSEIPHLLKLFNNLSSDVPLIFISPFSEKACSNILKAKKINSDGMISITDMDCFISGLFTKLEIQFHVYPFHVIIDKTGKIVAYISGNIEAQEDTDLLTNFIENL